MLQHNIYGHEKELTSSNTSSKRLTFLEGATYKNWTKKSCSAAGTTLRPYNISKQRFFSILGSILTRSVFQILSVFSRNFGISL